MGSWSTVVPVFFLFGSLLTDRGTAANGVGSRKEDVGMDETATWVTGSALAETAETGETAGAAETAER